MANLRQTTEEMRRAVNALANHPPRQGQAERHLRGLERLLIHGNSHSGHPGLSERSVLRGARRFLVEYNDWGFLLDDDAPSP
jgi:hypothetical protein